MTDLRGGRSDDCQTRPLEDNERGRPLFEILSSDAKEGGGFHSWGVPGAPGRGRLERGRGSDVRCGAQSLRGNRAWKRADFCRGLLVKWGVGFAMRGEFGLAHMNAHHHWESHMICDLGSWQVWVWCAGMGWKAMGWGTDGSRGELRATIRWLGSLPEECDDDGVGSGRGMWGVAGRVYDRVGCATTVVIVNCAWCVTGLPGWFRG